MSVLVSSTGFLKFNCKGADHYVPVPMANMEAYKRALQRVDTLGRPNVVVIMIDALSRAQFIRALPKTIDYFEELNKGNKFSVFDFEFFGILGAYSPPNRYAFFSGYPLADDQAFFEGSPFPLSEKVLRVNERNGVWMWDLLSERGYVTYSARDMCSRVAAYVYDDFVSKPWTDVHFQQLYCDSGYRTHDSSSEHCLGNRYAHNYVFQSGLQFFDAHPDVPRFLFLDFSEGHEPSMRIVRTMDDDILSSVKRFIADENTAVIVASDHGIGYGKQHITPNGPLEERLPALYMVMPNRNNTIFSRVARKNLQTNTQKLVTGIDVFETVMQLAGSDGKRPWAYSLLRPLPSRTCKEAGINIHACPCSLWDGKKPSRITWQ